MTDTREHEHCKVLTTGGTIARGTRAVISAVALLTEHALEDTAATTVDV